MMIQEFPPLHRASLDDATLQALVSDVSRFGGDVEVFAKASHRELADGQVTTLADALQKFQSGRVQGFQLRYDYQGERWCDTVTRRDGDAVLIRISLTTAANGSDGRRDQP